MWIGGSSPARRRHSTTAQSPPDSSPASLSSVLDPWPRATVRPAPGPVRTGSVRDMCAFLSIVRLSKPTVFLPRPLRPPTPVDVNLPSRLAYVGTSRCEGLRSTTCRSKVAGYLHVAGICVGAGTLVYESHGRSRL